MNEPAFPTSHEEPADFNGHNGSKKIVIDQGMTLRDYFAAKAMQGIMNSDRYVGIIGTNRYEYNTAKHAYQMADAMLEARK